MVVAGKVPRGRESATFTTRDSVSLPSPFAGQSRVSVLPTLVIGLRVLAMYL